MANSPRCCASSVGREPSWFESKTVNLLTLDQEVEGRQDEKHLRLAIANCAEFLRELMQRDRPADGLIRWAERLRTHANSQAGLKVQRKWRFEFPHAVPVDLWLQSPGPLQAWSEREAPKWRQEVTRKIRDVEDIERWVRELKRRSPGAGD